MSSLVIKLRMIEYDEVNTWFWEGFGGFYDPE